MSVSEIIFGQAGQSVRFIPHERVSAASVALEDLRESLESDSRFLFQGAATVDSYSGLTEAYANASGSNPWRLTVDSTSGLTTEDPIFIVDPSGYQELNSVAGFGASFIDLAHPVMRSFASGSAVYGAGLSVSFPDASASLDRYVDEERPLRAAFAFTGSNGAIVRHQTQVRVVRSSAMDASLGDVLRDFRILYPDLAGKHPYSAEQGLADQAELARRWVVADLSFSVDPKTIMLGEHATRLIVYRLALLFAEQGESPGNMDHQLFMEAAGRQYKALLGQVTTGKASEANTADLDIDEVAASKVSEKYFGPFERW